MMLISIIISVVWISMHGKNFMNNLPHGLPTVQALNNAINQRPAQNNPPGEGEQLSAQDEDLNKLIEQQAALKRPPSQIYNKLDGVSQHDLKELGMDTNSLSTEVISPMVTLNEKMNKLERSQYIIEDKWKAAKDQFNFWFGKFINNALNIFGILLLSVILFRLIKYWVGLRFVSGIYFGLSRFALVMASLASFPIAFINKINIWDSQVYFLFPVSVMCLGAFGLWLHDNNFPIWKRLYKSFILPMISVIAISFIL